MPRHSGAGWPEWRPIETAPRTGEWLLGWAASDSSPYRISWGRNHRGVEAWCTAFGSFVEGYITHWLPLPTRPRQGGEPG